MLFQLLTVAYLEDFNLVQVLLGPVEVDKYLGTEIEGTLSWTLHPGVNLDFIGSVVLAGDGLTDLLGSRRYRSRGYDLGVPDKADGLH